jgi:Ca2+/H+ antiporter, TMEM165/GDT1 family
MTAATVDHRRNVETSVMNHENFDKAPILRIQRFTTCGAYAVAVPGLQIDPTAVVQTFAAVFPAELPDKSMIATLALVTKLRNPKAVWSGVAVAFAMHVSLAAAIGGFLYRLPTRPVAGVAGAMFFLGAILMVKEAKEKGGAISSGDGDGDRNDDDDDGINSVQVRETATRFFPIAVTSFGVLAVAEFGDLTQFAVAGLSARTGEPLSVGIGGWLAEASVAAIAVVAGQWLIRKFALQKLQYVAAFVFAVLAVLAFREALLA